MSDDFTAPDVLNMFDHLHEDFKSKRIEGEVFQIKWTKDKCEIRNHMFAQVGPIAIIYEELGKNLPITSSSTKQNVKPRMERPHEIRLDECYVHRGFNKQYKK